LGLCVGYALLGSTWLVAKCEGRIRAVSYRVSGWLTLVLAIAFASVFAYALGERLEILQRWTERPWMVVFPVLGLVGVGILVAGLRRQRDLAPIVGSMMLFVSAFATFLASFWPYMIPFSLTIEEAASPPSSLWFMFWGSGLLAFPLTLVYTAMVYRIFRGKVATVGYD
jgi:cytochrome d ubiquinol oxidase subunit II